MCRSIWQANLERSNLASNCYEKSTSILPLRHFERAVSGRLFAKAADDEPRARHSAPQKVF
jgi:hypothetical protein